MNSSIEEEEEGKLMHKIAREYKGVDEKFPFKPLSSPHFLPNLWGWILVGLGNKQLGPNKIPSPFPSYPKSPLFSPLYFTSLKLSQPNIHKKMLLNPEA